MPYVEPDNRNLIDPFVSKAVDVCESWGDVNYAVTTLVAEYLLRNTIASIRYRDLQLAMGLFKCASKEFYRRIVVPYEKRKEFENGDIGAYQALLDKMGVKKVFPYLRD